MSGGKWPDDCCATYDDVRISRQTGLHTLEKVRLLTSEASSRIC